MLRDLYNCDILFERKMRKKRWILLKIGRKVAQNAENSHPDRICPNAGKPCAERPFATVLQNDSNLSSEF
jgi:hypothetical protein